MIERGSGRTSGHTNWQLMDVNSMWACLQDHDTTNHWKQVAGWRKVCDLAQIHLGRLQEYRRGLAEAWPPATSAASGAYLAQLDDLIDKVRHTHDAAAANYTALSAATQAIGTTRAALRQVHEEYAAKLQQKQAFEEIAADPKAAMGNRATESPVTDAELERLNVRARAMMFGLSGELQQAQATLQKPPAMPPPRSRRDPSSPDAYDSGIAPIIPPIVPVPLAPINAKPTLPGSSTISSPVQTVTGVGPILGGASPGVATAPTNAAHQGVQPNASTPSQALLPTPLSSGSTTRPLVPPPGKSGPLGWPSVKPVNDASHIPSTPQARFMPPNGIIGGAPGLGQPTAGGNSTRRVNPIGGVIGGGGAGTAPTGGAGSRPGAGRSVVGGSNFPPIGGAPVSNNYTGRGAPRDRLMQEHEDDRRAWDPDHPWAVGRGVDPVVRSTEEPGPPDPGPAIGFNR
ncbi:hypothetical protein ACFY2Q_05360 [Micromonospora sp. NPDC000316]|uniref:hypothetical protein n=1 Tax=Micromonospora sp. NPDC000316 TaxID=3364216 RepID=UPI00369C8500